ncbi:MAG: hypothetical protein FWD53_01640 [Phycisphaerales bacterium]|nr:hypothetical protein [Phycisphaerales bacterium]
MVNRSYEFSWDLIGDLQSGRPNMGVQVNLALYRLMQYTFHEVASKKLDRLEGNQIFHDAGNLAGKFFFAHFLTEHKGLPLEAFLGKLRSILDDNGYRFSGLDSVAIDKGEFALSVATGIEGAGLDAIKLDDCQYDIGFMEGVLSKYAGKELKATTVNVNTTPEISAKLGNKIHLIFYRMLQYTIRDAAERRIGTEACNQLYYEAGELAGIFFFDNFLASFKALPLNDFVRELQRILKDLEVGILRIEKADVEKGEFILTVSEDLDCSGLPDLGIEVCNYDEGFIAKIFDKYTGAVFKAKEVDCWCSGDRTCRFAVNRTI